jgi:hypothetical protein
MTVNPYQMPPTGQAPLPPQRRMSKSALISFILGLLFCVPLLTGALAVLMGIVGFVKTGKPGVTGRWMAITGGLLGLASIIFWLLFGAGILALVWGTQGPRVATHDFVQALAAGDIPAAKAHAGAFSDNDLKDLQDYVQKQGAFKDTTFLSTNINNNSATVDGVATFSSGTQHVTAELDKSGSDWKVQRINIRP